MTQLYTQQTPVVQVRPRANVYTVLLLVAILALAVAAGLVMHNLMSPDGYGMSFGEIFTGAAK